MPDFLGEPAEPDPLPDKDFEPHPALAPSGTLHVDLRQSGVTEVAGPLGRDPNVTSRRYGLVGMCGVLLWDREQRLYGICARAEQGEIVLEHTWLDRGTLDKRAAFELARFPVSEAQNTGGLVRFGASSLDAQGRLLVLSDGNDLQFVGPTAESEPSAPELGIVDTLPLGSHVPASRDVDAAAPTRAGRYWFVDFGTRAEDGSVAQPALVGCYSPSDDRASTQVLEGELIENNPALAEGAYFVVTDRALSRFECAADGSSLTEAWRKTYERPDAMRSDTLSAGSGSAPTVLGDDLVAITDNATPRIHMIAFRRSDGSRVCKTPLFEPGASANENTLVGYGNSVLAQNWAGAPDPFGEFREMEEPGLVRIDIQPEAETCEVAWRNDTIKTPNTVRVSTATGLIYATVQNEAITHTQAWYLAAVDFQTGELKNRTLLGTGPELSQIYNPPVIGPGGAVYQGTRSTLVSVRDGS